MKSCLLDCIEIRPVWSAGSATTFKISGNPFTYTAAAFRIGHNWSTCHSNSVKGPPLVRT